MPSFVLLSNIMLVYYITPHQLLLVRRTHICKGLQRCPAPGSSCIKDAVFKQLLYPDCQVMVTSLRNQLLGWGWGLH